MNKQKVRNFWVPTMITLAISFLLLVIGVRGILGNAVDIRNMLAFIILSSIFGVFSGGLYAFNLKPAFYLFITGIVAGFIMMYIQFFDGMTGWADLAGLLSLFMLAGMGLVAGLVVELVLLIVRKTKK